MTVNLPKSLYASFDTYPAPKGAAVHIREFSLTLFNHVGNGLLLVLGNDELPAWQQEENYEIRRLILTEGNYLERAMEFSRFTDFHVKLLASDLKIAHFRDPWGGIPIIRESEGNYKTVYEVNALPSIELPARYPGISARTLEKIHILEKECLDKASQVICPSEIIKKCLTGLGVKPSKITVIRNGARTFEQEESYALPELPGLYALYLGAVQSWQGLECLFKAMTFLKDLPELHLALCVSGNKARIKYLQKLAERLEISERLIWNLRLNQLELQPWLNNATLSLAPLVECSRNLVQGCCPIKIIESMTAGVPVIASDLPVVRELITHNKTGWLVRADRPSELARAIRILIAHPEARNSLATAAQKKALKWYSWEKAAQKLKKVYDAMLYSKKINKRS